MSSIQIKTPFNVNLAAQEAGVGWRILAFMLDLIFIGLYIWSIHFVFYGMLEMKSAIFEAKNSEEIQNDWIIFIQVIYIILLFPAFFYSLWTEYIFNGQTFGKMISGIRVVKLEGYRPGFSEYFTRWAFRFVDFWTGFFMLLFFIPLFGEEIAIAFSGIMLMGSGVVAFFLIAKTNNSQRLGDVIAGTTVLKLKEKKSMAITILEEIKDSYVPTYSQVLKLSDNDARIIKDTFTQAKKKRDTKTLLKLRTKLESVMEIKSTQNDVEFIDTVMKDFNYYTQKL